ncbi:hypothetical protein N8I77_012642 [Diaporthe amygdali]|uniref:Ubiquitin-like domain-containing protein n=1 Tax=Phomopsis amygdali TaxID=1214568 RepID=A0AAD9S5Y8_PHOAM|nr:hypothetical protein N8I77_012642 [Diaporthe amygdali]
MADIRAMSSVQATVAFGQKLANLLQTLVELNPRRGVDLEEVMHDILGTSGTLRQIQDLMGLDEAMGFGQTPQPTVTSAYLNEIETLAVKCDLIYKTIMLIAQKAVARDKAKKDDAELPNLENLKSELLVSPIPDPGSIKSIRLFAIVGSDDQERWIDSRIERCQEQLQWIRMGLLVHLHILKLAQLQIGSVVRDTGAFEQELISRSAVQLLRKRQVKFTKRKARQQESAQRQWELRRQVDDSDTESVTSVASSQRSSVTAKTAVDEEASVKGETPMAKSAAEFSEIDKNRPTSTNNINQKDGAAGKQGETMALSADSAGGLVARNVKGKALSSSNLSSKLEFNLPAYFFDWKQRIFGSDDKFKTDWPSTNLEAYIRHIHSFGKSTKIPFGHKRLQYGLSKVIKEGEKGTSTWSQYIELGQVTRLAVDEVVGEANRNQSRERICVAFHQYDKDSADPFILVFLSLRKEPQPISFKDAVGRTYTLPFEACRTWDAMKCTILEAFNHVEVIGPHVIEGHFDLITSKGDIILSHLWNTTIKPGAAIEMRMWPKVPLSGFYGKPPFLINPHAPNADNQARHAARMRQMQQQRMAAMRNSAPMSPGMAPPPPPPGMGFSSYRPPGGVPPGHGSFGNRPQSVVIVDYAPAKHEVTEKEDEQIMFVDFVEELEKDKTTTVADLLQKFTNLKDVPDDDCLGEFLTLGSDYDSDDSTTSSPSSEIIND